ncbi:hypothetical protein [Vulcaniibacterium tengchongense]|uniref:Uncharacterized protein n=1 Tax=Vulcaniibacterium tengchongense TaxID=1273429 RepID=A0A3N4VNJ4_9GAMM|nr:hypothetical protein [Vulcaniibacterium tengchongense]RPE74654.1 hypothetical protein EDC50_3183 [Vulcaniibacterium tengchongense]
MAERNDAPRRWARTVVIDGVLALLTHTYDSDAERYCIGCTVQADHAEVSIKIHLSKPATQDAFDDAATWLPQQCLERVKQFGMTPVELTPEEAAAAGEGALPTLKRIVEAADAHPFNPIGHVIEHVVPEAREVAARHAQEPRHD